MQPVGKCKGHMCARVGINEGVISLRQEGGGKEKKEKYKTKMEEIRGKHSYA